MIDHSVRCADLLQEGTGGRAARAQHTQSCLETSRSPSQWANQPRWLAR